eukprot:5122242-Prymnesium_polylepis.1
MRSPVSDRPLPGIHAWPAKRAQWASHRSDISAVVEGRPLTAPRTVRVGLTVRVGVVHSVKLVD